MWENLKACVPTMSLSPFLGWFLASNSALASPWSWLPLHGAWSFWTKPMGRRALFGLFIWIYKLDSSEYQPRSPSSIPTKVHTSETQHAPNKKFTWKIFEQKLHLRPRQEPNCWWEKSESKAMGTEKRRSRWLLERPVFQGEGGGMLKRK